MTDDEWIEAFEAEGEDRVRLRLNAKQINLDGSRVAVQWLAEKDQESRRKSKITKRIELTLAIVAATAATIAAIAGIIELAR